MLRLGDLTPQTAPALAIVHEKVKALFVQFHRSVFRFVMCKTRNSGKAQEITQESFLRLFCHLRDAHPIENPKAWLFAVAHIPGKLALDTGVRLRVSVLGEAGDSPAAV